MISNNYNRLVNSFSMLEDKELGMIGCILITYHIRDLARLPVPELG